LRELFFNTPGPVSGFSYFIGARSGLDKILRPFSIAEWFLK